MRTPGTLSIYHARFLKAVLLGGLLTWTAVAVRADDGYPHPLTNPGSPIMLAGDWVQDDARRIDFDRLLRVPSQHSTVSDVRDAGGSRVNQHNYLAHFDGRFWAIWSDGPGVQRGPADQHRNRVPGHDQAGQHVSFAVSADGIHWSEVRDLAGEPEPGFGWIARGLWIREGKLLALASRYHAPGYAGPGLQLHAFELVPGQPPAWKHLGIAFDDALNNFAPKLLPDGQWMMSRRDHQRNIHLLFGGTEAFDRWESVPFVGYRDTEMAPEEPYWWILPDGNLVALFRDNARSGFLFRAFSTDDGRTWSRPVRTNFPDATSKFHGLRLSDGRYVLVSNANPRRRDPLTIAISDDGLVFTKLGYLVGGRHVDYPHVIEHDEHLYVAFASAKQTVEVLRIRIADLEDLDMAGVWAPPPEPLRSEMDVDGISIALHLEGNWGTSDKAEEKYGDTYFFLRPGDRGLVRYTPQLPDAGEYEVFAWWNSRGSRYHAVPYVVHHADGVQTITVDQNRQGGGWVSLGRYRFDTDGAFVELKADRFPNYVVAEAVRFVPVADGGDP
jgi:hypothetical protein